ncbi:MAG TPA: heme ABC exporter ATP-binding protein CcmA [Gemmatimonadales bacterium]
MPSHEGTPLLEARGLRRSFGRARILHGIDLSLGPGEALAIIGPNGSGKTTLLRLLAGLMRPTAGEVFLAGQRLGRGTHEVRRAIGFVSHQSLLYDDLTLLENLTLTARLYLLQHPREVARAALDAAGLVDRSEELPKRLSRGLLQRAAIARSTLHDPSVLLLDEPFTGLDAAASTRLRGELQARVSRGVTLVVVTHHLGDAWDLASRVAVLVGGRWAAEEPRSGTLDAFLPRYQRLAGV